MEDFVRVANKGVRNEEVASEEWLVASFGSVTAVYSTPHPQVIAESFAND
jgi:hypothetical protein